MPILSTLILKQNNLMDVINYEKFLLFITNIFNRYRRDVSYHNDLHGSDVAQHCSFLLNSQRMNQYAQFEKMDTLALIVAALCHDVGHDGYNNMYHKTTKSHIFQMFGEQ